MDCWAFPHLELKKKVTVRNKKYCWLYPEEKAKTLNKLVPDFSDCKTLYTRCDYILEQKTQQQILKLEDLFRRHTELVNNEMKVQGALIDKMWYYSQRYLILTNSGVCIKPYPEIASEQAETSSLCEFHKRLLKLKNSVCRIEQSLDVIKTAMENFEQICAKLDYSIESPFLLGTCSQKPLARMREILMDLYNFYFDDLCMLKRWSQPVTPGDSGAIEDYQQLLKGLQGDREDLWLLAEQCRCKFSHNPNCKCQYLYKREEIPSPETSSQSSNIDSLFQ